MRRFFLSFGGWACKGNFAVSFHDKVIFMSTDKKDLVKQVNWALRGTIKIDLLTGSG